MMHVVIVVLLVEIIKAKESQFKNIRQNNKNNNDNFDYNYNKN